MKKLILLTLLLSNLFSGVIDMPLSKFASLVAVTEKINIIVDSDIDSSKEIFYIESENQISFILPSFKKLLDKRGYKLVYIKDGDFYLVTKILDEKISSHFFQLDSPIFEDIRPTLDLMDVKYSYIENTHTLVYFCIDSVDKDIKKLIQYNDNAPEQFSLKITIIETNLSDIKERGVNFDSYIQSLSGSAQFFVKMLSLPYSATTNVFDSSKVGFTSIIRYMNENSLSEIISSPYFTVQSNKIISFSAVENIPYKVASSQVSGASSSTVENTEYRDVGLKIKLLPKIINEVIYIDLDLVIENIIDRSSLTPSTSKRSLNNNFQLKKGEILVLSGINQIEKQNNHYGIPVLENIPFLGKIFTFDTVSEIEKNLTIAIEVL